MYRLAKTFEESGEFEQAKKIYEDIYQAQPWNITFIEALNNIYLLLKKYDKSIELMTKKIESEPANINLYALLGNTYYQKLIKHGMTVLMLQIKALFRIE